MMLADKADKRAQQEKEEKDVMTRIVRMKLDV